MRNAVALVFLLLSAATPAVAELFQLHGDGQMFRYDGNGQCTDAACPGWTMIDKNAATKQFSGGFGGLYQLHSDGKIWRYDGRGQCAGNTCPGWTLIDKNTRSVAITGGPGGLYQRQVDGQIWKYDGHGECTNKLCPGWTEIDKNPRTVEIVAASGTVFQRHVDGRIFKYDGRGQCTENACPGWTLIDANQATQAIAGASGGFYQRHGDGQIFKYDGAGQCNLPIACPGWTQVDKNPATQTITAGGATLYQLHADGKYWRHDGRGQCSANLCPGWTNIDKNPATKQISADRDTAFQRHADGKIWKHDGRGQCSENACPGWTNIDKNPATVSILAVESGPSPVIGDLIGGSPVRGILAVRDDNGRIVFSNNTFFSSASLCNQLLAPRPGKPTLEERIKSLIGERLAEGPFKMRSDSSATLSRNCSARAELAATGNNDIRLSISLPQNSFSLFLTTPDLDVPILGPIGLPGSTDPHAIISFDISVQTVITVPEITGFPLRAEEPTASATNIRLDPQNFTAGAIVAANDVVRFFGGDFLRRLTRDRTISLDDLGDFLNQFNTQLQTIPRGIGLVSSYDRGPGNLVIRSAQ
jgi:hypothetical protein